MGVLLFLLLHSWRTANNSNIGRGGNGSGELSASQGDQIKLQVYNSNAVNLYVCAAISTD